MAGFRSESKQALSKEDLPSTLISRVSGPRRSISGQNDTAQQHSSSGDTGELGHHCRGVLEHDFGLDPRKAQWYVERSGSGSTGEVLGFKPPHGISVQQTPGGKSLVAMLAAGELDMAWIGGNLQAQAGNALRPLFADAIAEGKRFYDAHGYVPANHMYMVRGSLAREHPALVAKLYRAFHESKALAQQSLPRETPRGLLFGNEQLARTCESFAGDPFSYGIDSNRAMLETVVHLCQEQGLVRDKSSIEQLFVPGT